MHFCVFTLNFVSQCSILAAYDPTATKKNGATATLFNCQPCVVNELFGNSASHQWICFSQPLHDSLVSPVDEVVQLCSRGSHRLVVGSYAHLWLWVYQRQTKREQWRVRTYSLTSLPATGSCYSWRRVQPLQILASVGVSFRPDSMIVLRHCATWTIEASVEWGVASHFV